MEHTRLRPASFVNDRNRNNFYTKQSAEKLVEKYNSMAKEALSSGDIILSENCFQHADHFMRIIEEKNLNQNKINVENRNETNVSNEHLNKDVKINKDQEIKEKKE